MPAELRDTTCLGETAFDFPDLRICIAHLRVDHMYTALVLAEKHRNMSLDAASLGHFASRFFPPTAPTALSDEEQAKVLGLDACGLLGIDRIL